MPSGEEFIKHEFDEAIAVQQTIVRGAKELASVHPIGTTRTSLKTAGREAERWLDRLEKAGSKFGATGKREDVASGIDELAVTTLKSAKGGEPSEVYEAHAVVVNAMRKQQDSAGAVIKIATSLRDRELAAEAREMQRATRKAADGLARQLSELAVVIAANGRKPAASRSSTNARTAGRSKAKSRKSSSARTTAKKS